MGNPSDPSCANCNLASCLHKDKDYPPFCPTRAADPAELAEVVERYRGDEEDGRVARAAAEVMGTYYGQLTRVEEIIALANRIGAKKIGVAACLGLAGEARTFTRILERHGLASHTVICKVGAMDLTEIGLAENLKLTPGCHESLCNPILQAQVLNRSRTDFNVLVGLCVGHDSLFIKHSEALVTTLITKDRVLAHNPAAALYTSGTFYQRLLAPKQPL